MKWLRHPPYPAERLAQRLGFETRHAEYLYSDLKRRYLWLSWPGVMVGVVVAVVWMFGLMQFMPLIFGPQGSNQDVGFLVALAPFVYIFGVVFVGGLYVGSLAKWYTNDRAIRRFIAEYIDTPQCFACGYGLTGVPRGADGELRCPECTQNWPWHKRIRDPRPFMSAIDPPRATGDAPHAELPDARGQ